MVLLILNHSVPPGMETHIWYDCANHCTAPPAPKANQALGSSASFLHGNTWFFSPYKIKLNSRGACYLELFTKLKIFLYYSGLQIRSPELTLKEKVLRIPVLSVRLSGQAGSVQLSSTLQYLSGHSSHKIQYKCHAKARLCTQQHLFVF